MPVSAEMSDNPVSAISDRCCRNGRGRRTRSYFAFCQATVSAAADLYRDEPRWLQTHSAALWQLQPKAGS
jgi:hypothetical protein